jgi:hypothetical protein
MFKKAKDIAPLHPGMADAMGVQLARQGFKTPEAPAVVEEPIVQVEPQEIEEATDGHKGRHADKADGDKKKPVVTDVTPEIGLISTNDKAAKSVLTAIKASAKPTAIKASYSEAKAVKEDCDEDEKVEEGTLPPALQKAIDKKNGKKVDKKDEDEELSEDNTNKKSDDGEGLDKVQPKAVKKKFVNRLDKDIDNDGDTDDSDEYLHRRRKAVAKALED